MGKVYLLNAYGTDNYKIGVTKSDVSKRVKQLQTGCPDEIIVLKEVECENYLKVEKYMHRLHGTNRIEGEWFVLDHEAIIGFIDECKKMDSTYQYLIEQNPYFK